MGEQEQVPSLGRVELENAGEIVGEIGRDADLAALFEPCVPREADSCVAPPPPRGAAPVTDARTVFHGAGGGQ